MAEAIEDRGVGERRERMGVVARADAATLQALWGAFEGQPAHTSLRGPETGLVMVRGRIGGTGPVFNVGEATVTRVTVRLESGAVGHAVVLGREPEKARIAAVLDALCEAGETDRVEAAILGPIRRTLAADDARAAEETAATRVDFFTMARGEDAR